MKFRNLIPLIPAVAVLSAMMLSHSCANTTTSPTGGDKDTIPPQLMEVFPLPGALMVPTTKTKIVFTFDEYVKIKEQKNIILSPPQTKPLKAAIKGKSVVITFEEPLKENTTYSLDLTGAIADNNEGNLFPGYTLVFSTGEKIDSMYVTGIVQDCETLNPLKGATVLLYKDQRDSAIFLHLPDAATKTDEWGFFCLRNIQDTCYRLYALKDENNNNKYDPGSERIAFADSVISPAHKVGDDIYELFKFDMKDTTSCLKRKNDYELNIFKEKTSKQMITNKGRINDRTAFIAFMSANPKILSLKVRGITDKRIIRQFDQKRDSMLLWLNDPRKAPDTIHVSIDYMKSDSTGTLVRTNEKLKIHYSKEQMASIRGKKSSRRDIKHEDTIAVYKVKAEPEKFEQYGIEIAFDYPLVKEYFDSLKYTVTNPRQKTEPGKYTLERDTLDIRKVHIHHSGKILPGYEYKLVVPHRKFRDINGYLNDSVAVSIKLPEDEKLSKLTLNMTGVGTSRYIVDLMNEKRADVIRSYTITKDTVLDFPYLKEGKYCLRVTRDDNHNNLVDTGDLLTHRQPEMVRFFKLQDGTFLFSILSSSEISQDVDLKQMFK